MNQFKNASQNNFFLQMQREADDAKRMKKMLKENREKVQNKKTIEEQFVPYELAVKLKELGFKCDYSFKEYDTEGHLQHTGLLDSHSLPHIDAPLWQQAFDWFRLTHKIYSTIDVYPTKENPDRCWYKLKSVGDIKLNSDADEREDSFTSGWFDSYEEAQLSCLKKLITFV